MHFTRNPYSDTSAVHHSALCPSPPGKHHDEPRPAGQAVLLGMVLFSFPPDQSVTRRTYLHREACLQLHTTQPRCSLTVLCFRSPLPYLRTSVSSLLPSISFSLRKHHRNSRKSRHALNMPPSLPTWISISCRHSSPSEYFPTDNRVDRSTSRNVGYRLRP